LAAYREQGIGLLYKGKWYNISLRYNTSSHFIVHN
jgi:hypothetical protein